MKDLKQRHDISTALQSWDDAEINYTVISSRDRQKKVFDDDQKKLITFLTKTEGLKEAAPVSVKLAIQMGYIQFLNQWNWDYFYTLTFREDIHPDYADKLFKRWISGLNRQYFGKRYYKRSQFIDWSRAKEFQKNGRLHYHGLMNTPPDFNPMAAKEAWLTLDGNIMEGKTGIARIHRAIQPAAEVYVTKYITKELNIDVSDSLHTLSKNSKLIHERTSLELDGGKVE